MKSIATYVKLRQMHVRTYMEELREYTNCYSLSPLTWYLPSFLLMSFSFTLWYVFLRLGSLPDPSELA